MRIMTHQMTSAVGYIGKDETTIAQIIEPALASGDWNGSAHVVVDAKKHNEDDRKVQVTIEITVEAVDD